MNYYDERVRPFREYEHENQKAGEQVVDYMMDYLGRVQGWNKSISVEEIRQHCNRLLGISIPYEAFVGALLYDNYRVHRERTGDYINLSNRSVIAKLMRGEPVNRKSIVGDRILRYYGERGLDGDLFQKLPHVKPEKE